MIRKIQIDDTLLDNFIINNITNSTKYGVSSSISHLLGVAGGVVKNVEKMLMTSQIDGTLTGDNEADLMTKKNELLRIINASETHTIIFYDQDDNTYTANAIVEPLEGEQKRYNIEFAKMSFRITFFEPLHSPFVTASSGLARIVGMPIPTPIPASFLHYEGGVSNATNEGNIDWFIDITMYGPATNPVLRNITHDEHIRFNGTLNSISDYVHIYWDNGLYAENQNGEDVVHLLSYTLPRIHVGDNEFFYIADDWNADARVEIIYASWYYGI